MKIIVIPDSFKGSLSSVKAASIIGEELKKQVPGVEVTEIPVADGGEGTLDCFAGILGGERVKCEVTGPNFKKVTAEYLLCGDTAFIEMACAAGLPLANPKSAKATTTFGVGELVKKAEERGAKKFVLGIGGSATNDGGWGFGSALGGGFLDGNGKEFVPVGETLHRICKIIPAEKRDITVLCDVKNPLCGKNGAAEVYAPQKGADENDVKMLDSGLAHLAGVLGEEGRRLAEIPGAGAAGGMGFGLTAFFGAKLKRGIDAVLDLAGFDSLAESADAIITGEGSLDSQSFSGKVIDGIIARSAGKKVYAVVGISKLDDFEKFGLSGVFESNYRHLPFEEVLPTAQEDLRAAAAKLARAITK